MNRRPPPTLLAGLLVVGCAPTPDPEPPPLVEAASVLARVDVDRVQFSGKSAEQGGFSWSLQGPAAKQVTRRPDRLELDHGGVVEWYRRRPGGVELGFTIDRTTSSTVDLTYVVAGLTPRIACPADACVALVDTAGRARFDVRDLEAWDADRVPLRAWFSVANDTLAIHVDVATARFPVTIDPTIGPSARLRGSATADVDELGTALALQKDLLAVGAPGDPLDGGGVFVYGWASKTGWTNQALLPRPTDADRFGSALSFSGDLLAVGADFTDDPPVTSAGAVFVFQREATTWKSIQTLRAEAKAPVAFGHAIAASGDLLLIGGQGSSLDGTNGVAEVWAKAGTTFSRVVALSPPKVFEDFGSAVAIAGDVAVVGAPFATVDTVDEAGAVYVFVKSGGTWKLDQRVVAPAPSDSAHFGYAVSVSDKRLVVGAPGDDDGAKATGSVYVFDRVGATFASPKGKAFQGTADLEEFGYSVATADDLVLVGARSAGKDNEGEVHVYTYDGKAFVEKSKLLPLTPVFGLNFGASVALSGNDGAVGSAHQFGAGEAYVYRPLIAFADGKGCAVDAECEHGHCVEGTCCAATSCAPFGCATGSCATTCTATTGCAKTAYCEGGACKPLKVDGTGCTDKAQCASGFCEGSYCCDTACLPFVCASNGKCKTTCVAPADCATGFVCTAGSCVQGARCNAEGTASIGKDEVVTPCSPLRCVDGACLKQCATSADCQSGFACDTSSGKCLAGAAPTDTDSGGGCTTHRGRPTHDGVAFVAVLGWLVRRRRKGA
ncbi:MAG: FG-GAP repeat protein [Myxococcales bacterium]|nr:FG-GAP repeat protein [Myxococcales bacterium]